MISQNYLLGVSFFFMAVGTLWGLRFLGGFVTLQISIRWESLPTLVKSHTMKKKQIIQAGPNMIYAQALGAAVMWFAHRRISNIQGDTSFGCAVASYIPLGLLLGVGTWIEWADYEVYPLGISIVGLCGLAMYSALMSIKPSFRRSKCCFGIIPIVYEILVKTPPGNEAPFHSSSSSSFKDSWQEMSKQTLAEKCRSS